MLIKTHSTVGFFGKYCALDLDLARLKFNYKIEMKTMRQGRRRQSQAEHGIIRKSAVHRCTHEVLALLRLIRFLAQPPMYVCSSPSRQSFGGWKQTLPRQPATHKGNRDSHYSLPGIYHDEHNPTILHPPSSIRHPPSPISHPFTHAPGHAIF